MRNLLKNFILPARPEEMVGISMARGPEIARRLKKIIARIDGSPLTRRAVAMFVLAACVSVTSLAGLRVIHAGEANLPPTKTINPADVPPGARVLHFPTDRVMGKVLVTGKHYDRGYWYGPTATGWDEYDWEYLGEAHGDVLVPAGKLVKLVIAPPAVYQDLTPLRKLGPNDIHHLDISHDMIMPGFPSKKAPAGFDPDTIMPAIEGLTGLKVLNLNTTEIGEKGIGALCKLTALERLYPPRNLSARSYAVVSGLKSLKGLYILMPPERGSLADLAQLDGLEELWLYKQKYGSREFEPLASMPRIRMLNIAGQSMPEQALAPISRMASLKKLRVGADLSDRGLALLAASKSIEDLDLHNSSRVTDAGVARLESMSSLKSIRFGARTLTNKSIESLARNKSVESIDVAGDLMNDDALIALAGLPRLRRASFNLCYAADPTQNKPIFTERGLKELADNTRIEELMTGGAGINDAALAQIGRMTHLKRLEIFPLITATNAGLAKLDSLKDLEYVMIHNYSDAVTVAGLKQMGTHPKLTFGQLEGFVQDGSGLDLTGMPNMRNMILELRSHQSFSDDDMKGLAPLTHLERLLLGGNTLLTDRGLAHLAGLTSLSSQLVISGGRFTDDGMKYLSGMKDLTTLCVAGKIGDAGLVEISKLRALQSLEVVTSEPISPLGFDKVRNLPFMYRCDVGPLARMGNSKMPAPGKDAYEFKFMKLDGSQVKISALKKIVMLHFWATWDKTSLDPREIARLKQVNEMLSKKFPGRFELVSLALDDNDALWRETVRRNGMNWTQGRLHTQSAASYEYGIKILPAYFLLSPDGKVLLNPESSWKNVDAVIEKEAGRVR